MMITSLLIRGCFHMAIMVMVLQVTDILHKATHQLGVGIHRKATHQRGVGILPKATHQPGVGILPKATHQVLIPVLPLHIIQDMVVLVQCLPEVQLQLLQLMAPTSCHMAPTIRVMVLPTWGMVHPTWGMVPPTWRMVCIMEANSSMESTGNSSMGSMGSTGSKECSEEESSRNGNDFMCASTGFRALSLKILVLMFS